MFRTIKRIIDWCGDFKGKLYLGFVFSFFSYWFAAAPVMIAALGIGAFLLDLEGKLEFQKEWILWSFFAILIFIFLRFLFDYLRARFQETISYELVARDRLAVGDALKRVSLGYFQEKSTGNILNSITTGFSTLENMGIRMLDTFIGGYLNFLAIFLCLLVMSPKIAGIALLAALCSFLFLVNLSRHSKINAPIGAKCNRDLTGAAIEYARGLSVVKSFGKSGMATGAIKQAVEESMAIHLKGEWGFTPSNVLHLFSLKCGTVGIAAATCYGYLAGDLSLIVSLMMLFFSFHIFGSLEPISDSAHVLAVIDDAMDQLEALQEDHFLDENGKDITPESFDIVLDHVDFGYDERQILKDISLTIPEKTSTALVGPSGSGKTTLINLIARFYDVKGGRITLGGRDIREYTCDSLLRNISMVFQNVYLFHDTIRANILFGKPDATEAEMVEAAKKARCHDFIMKLPRGYDTVIGEGGGTLSGGEKQRVSIARVMLKDAPIIILDEATASIDPENEHLIQGALSELTRGKTIITIAHRLATIEHADQIVVLEEGRIVQKGVHADLIREEGLYKRFTEARSRAEGWSIQA